MDFSDSSSGRNSLIPSFLYSSSSKTLPLHRMLHSTAVSAAAPSPPPANLDAGSRGLMIPSPSESRKIELYSPAFYAACTAGGILSCGLTHMTVTPLDLVKCFTAFARLCYVLLLVFVIVRSVIFFQIDPAKYKNISSGFGVLLKEQGFKGFFRGWVPTLLGYSAQGACKFGFYEFFKKYYSDIAGPEYASKYKTLIYLAGSASAEVIADVALCPFEAVKVRVQTQPGFARGLADGLPKFVKSEGTLGLYKGIVPLWGRQIPLFFGDAGLVAFVCTSNIYALFWVVAALSIVASTTVSTTTTILFIAHYHHCYHQWQHHFLSTTSTVICTINITNTCYCQHCHY
ncbi:hypothetical protein ACSQ67_000779 [Phaseolus vulgaris]